MALNYSAVCYLIFQIPYRGCYTKNSIVHEIRHIYVLYSCRIFLLI